jgi:hypothetical protein
MRAQTALLCNESAVESPCEVIARLQKLAPCIQAQLQAANSGQPVHTSRKLVDHDIHLMGTAAKHLFGKPIAEYSVADVRREQRGRKPTTTLPPPPPPPSEDEVSVLRPLREFLGTDAFLIDPAIIMAVKKEQTLGALEPQNPSDVDAQPLPEITPFSGTAWNLNAEPFYPAEPHDPIWSFPVQYNLDDFIFEWPSYETIPMPPLHSTIADVYEILEQDEQDAQSQRLSDYFEQLQDEESFSARFASHVFSILLLITVRSFILKQYGHRVVSVFSARFSWLSISTLWSRALPLGRSVVALSFSRQCQCVGRLVDYVGFGIRQFGRFGMFGWMGNLTSFGIWMFGWMGYSIRWIPLAVKLPLDFFLYFRHSFGRLFLDACGHFIWKCCGVLIRWCQPVANVSHRYRHRTNYCLEPAGGLVMETADLRADGYCMVAHAPASAMGKGRGCTSILFSA